MGNCTCHSEEYILYLWNKEDALLVEVLPGVLASAGALFVDDEWDVSARDFSWICSDLISFCPVCELKSWTSESDFATSEVDDKSILKASDKHSLATSRLSISVAALGSTVKHV